MSIALNDAQRAAVEHPPGPMLVVAGAGSGKTRVLTARVAWLIARGAPPHAILAFTFTNRAAREMRQRIEAVVGEAARDVWVGTFHATAVRILRRESEVAGLPRNFAIYDREDQESLLREAMGSLDLPEGVLRPAAVLNRISDAKNALVTPDTMSAAAATPHEQRIATCYAAYQALLRQNGALDFDDLIGETVKLLEGPDAGPRYARRFQHVLVDEYQDTNHAQFRMIERLAAGHGSLFAVGDDDQSIYGWRGANLANLLTFEQTFEGAAVLRLEQNYRSTARILRAANAVIAHNRSRKGKTLWCDREEGAPLRFALLGDEIDEARHVRSLLFERRSRGLALRDCAVLYRTNAQSRAIETELRQSLVPYEIVGGISFYQRREVKDLLAYLRLVVLPEDTVSFWRAWNTPRRGLGPAVRVRVEDAMAAQSCSPVVALRALAATGGLSGAARKGAGDLLALLDALTAVADGPADALFALLLERSGYLDHLDRDDDASDRRANVQELGVAMAGFASTRGGTLAEFLAEAALVTDLDRLSEDDDRVLMLTAHNAKGLEFPVVIVAGLEEGLFPHASSLDDPEQLEEERRLFYVAMTRARDEVLLTAAAYRRRFDGARGGVVSRFVDEIPEEIVTRTEADRFATSPRGGRGGWSGGSGTGNGSGGSGRVAESAVALAPRRNDPAAGREVYHAQFGRGVVIASEGGGFDVKYTVRFGTVIRKVLGRFLSGGFDGD